MVKPILFNTDMVRAILEGRKTVTRRVVKPQPIWMKQDAKYRTCPSGWWWRKGLIKAVEDKNLFAQMLMHEAAPYRPGDILWVRETWRVGAWDIPRQMIASDYADGTCGQLVYIANREMFMRLVDQSREDARKAKCVYNGVDFVWEKGKSPCRWRPSIHMPREAARIFMRVTDVRVERLTAMSAEDALKEGCVPSDAYDIWTARDNFHELWDSTINPADRKKYGWEASPWVWVIEFERISKDEAMQ